MIRRKNSIAAIAVSLIVASCGHGGTSDAGTTAAATPSDRDGADASQLPTADIADATLPDAPPLTTAPPTVPTPTAPPTVATPTAPPSTEPPPQPPLSADTAFGSESSTLTAAGRADLGARLDEYGGCPSRIALVSHTDWRGEDDYNLDLSRRRAEAVRDWFGDSCEPDPSTTIDARGEADAHPSGASQEQMASDRRVDIELAGPVTGPAITPSEDA